MLLASAISLFGLSLYYVGFKCKYVFSALCWSTYSHIPSHMAIGLIVMQHLSGIWSIKLRLNNKASYMMTQRCLFPTMS